ncbi:MAG: anaerobic ribonucleoside-triphosphate reductase [Paenalcaligenes sp.]
MTTKQHPVLRDEDRQPCEIWTRVMGYHRPVSSFNIGKQGEFNERLHFTEQPMHVITPLRKQA